MTPTCKKSICCIVVNFFRNCHHVRNILCPAKHAAMPCWRSRKNLPRSCKRSWHRQTGRTGWQEAIALHSCCDLWSPEVFLCCSNHRLTQKPGRHTAVRNRCSLWDGGSMFSLVSHPTGASHASHLGCPSAYGSRVSYVKKRQVWKSRSETDWPHNGTSGIFENRQETTFKAADLLLLWSDSSQFNGVEREISCQHVDANMRMLRFFSVEKPGIIPRWGQSVSDRDFHTCLFFMYDTLLP